jgi:hypothetical protein
MVGGSDNKYGCKVSVKNLKGIDHFGDLDVDVGVILRLIFCKLGNGFWDMKVLNGSR